MNDPRSKDSSEPLDKQETLWGINDLVITLPNRTKMIVYPESKKTFEQKQKILQKNQIIDVPTLSTLNDKIAINIS